MLHRFHICISWYIFYRLCNMILRYLASLFNRCIYYLRYAFIVPLTRQWQTKTYCDAYEIGFACRNSRRKTNQNGIWMQRKFPTTYSNTILYWTNGERDRVCNRCTIRVHLSKCLFSTCRQITSTVIHVNNKCTKIVTRTYSHF